MPTTMCRFPAVLFLLLVLAQIEFSESDVNPMKSVEAARLFACKALGYDAGVNKAFNMVLLSADDAQYTRQCLLGCDLSLFFAANSLFEFETGMYPISKLFGPIWRRGFFYAQQCVKVSMMSQEKCSLVKTLGLCMGYSYKNYLIRKFIPWWPSLKAQINQIVDLIGPLRRLRDWLRRFVYDQLHKFLTRSDIKPIVKWIVNHLKNGVLHTIIKNAVSSLIVLLSGLVIPPGIPNPVPLIMPVLKFLLSL